MLPSKYFERIYLLAIEVYNSEDKESRHLQKSKDRVSSNTLKCVDERERESTVENEAP